MTNAIIRSSEVVIWSNPAIYANTILGPLQQVVQELHEQLHRHCKVSTHKEAPAYFNHDVQPETVLRYIKEEGLPVPHRGRLYFIKVEDLFEWQLGRSNETD